MGLENEVGKVENATSGTNKSHAGGCPEGPKMALSSAIEEDAYGVNESSRRDGLRTLHDVMKMQMLMQHTQFTC